MVGQGRVTIINVDDPEAALRQQRPDEADRERDRLLRQLVAVLRQLPGGVVIVEAPSGRIIFRNELAEALFPTGGAVTLEEYVARDQSCVLDPQYQAPEDRPLMRALRRGEVVTGAEVNFRRPDGRRLTVRVHAAPARDGRGDIIAAVATFHDITEQKRAAEDARFLAEVSEALASSLDYKFTLATVANLAVPYFADWCVVDMVEEDGAIRQVAVAHAEPAKVNLAWELDQRYPENPAAAEGVPKVVRTGRPELFPDIGDPLLQAVARDAGHLEALRKLELKSGMIVPLAARGRVLGTISLGTAESGRRYGPEDLALAEELAHRAAVAVDNARLYRDLRDADRRKVHFLAALGHELRNPLAPIRNALHLLRQGGHDPDTFAWACAVADRQLRHLTRLVDDLLDVSRIGSGKVQLRPEARDLVGLVRAAAEDHRPLLEDAGLALEVRLPAGPVWARADGTRISQIVGNLLHNAAKFTDRGGRVTVGLEVGGDRRAVLRVCDTGIGIDPEMLPHVFETFAQADRSLDRTRGGLGLGLSLVKGLVELHGGEVRAASAGVGQGAEFTVWLPLAEAGPAPAAEAATTPVPVKSLRILIVEDNLDTAQSLKALLTLCGHEVRLAHTGPDGVAAAREFRPGAVLCDLGLPGLNGFEVAEALRQDPATAEALLVAMTGYGQDEDRRRAHDAGFHVHLVKPFDPEELNRILAAYPMR
jgi:PAS domain S-box-containing protein